MVYESLNVRPSGCLSVIQRRQTGVSQTISRHRHGLRHTDTCIPCIFAFRLNVCVVYVLILKAMLCFVSEVRGW